MQLQIETTNTCNADCVFCPYSAMTRPKQTMSMALFTKILSDAQAIPAIDKVTLTGLGEPLLDRFIVERVRTIKAMLPHVLIDLYTNGTFLRPATTDALIEAGLGMLYISLNAVDADARQQIMQLDDYDTVVGYIQYAIEAVKGTGCQVIVKGVSGKDLMERNGPATFLSQWGGPYDEGGAAFLHLEGNWAGSMGQKMRVQMKEACPRALEQIMVLADGRVSLCCFDAHGEVILGDLNTTSIRDVFHGRLATDIRTAHMEGRRRELALCNTCTSI